MKVQIIGITVSSAKIAFFNSMSSLLIRIIPNSHYDNRMTKGHACSRNFATLNSNPLDKLTVLAFTHKHFYLDDLGKLVVEKSVLPSKLQGILADESLGIQEVFYLATCNRVEFVMNTPNGFSTQQAQELLGDFYHEFAPIQLSNLFQYAKIYRGTEAVKHLFEVSCSMDSMVIGEREIARQLRQAYEDCRELGTTGDFLRLLMKQAVVTSKEVYSETRIAAKPISVASLAIRKLEEFNLTPEAGIVLVGAGETNTLVSKYLKKAGYVNFTVYNRTLEKAQKLANYLGGKAYPLEAFSAHADRVSVLISCTASPEPIITTNIWEKLPRDPGFPAVVIDLAVPGDVSTEVSNRADVAYVNIEVLKQEVERNLEFRESELEKAREIIDRGIEAFGEMQRIRNVELALSAFPEQVKEVRKKALEEVFTKELSNMEPATRALIEKMMLYMEKKCISIPIKVAKSMLLEKKSQPLQSEISAIRVNPKMVERVA